MSLLKTNEIQNYNGSSLTLTASTVSTSAQLNTGGNISVTGSLNVSDDSTTRTNLGLGTIATQDSDSITVTGGTATLGALTVSGSDSGDLVRITQTGSGNALVVEDSANPDSTPFVVDASGNLLVGTTSAVSNQGVIQAKTSVTGGPGAYSAINTGYNSGNSNWSFGMNSAGAFVVYINPAVSGNLGVYLSAGATSWTGNSDERLKDITGNIENAIESVQSLRAVKYTLKADNAEIKTQRVGLIAQDVQTVLPEIIDEDQDGYLGIRYTEAIPLLVAAIKEQQVLIESQQSQIDALTARIEALENI
jgi:hypothetical protein